MEYHIAPMTGAHKAREDLNTFELIFRKGLGKLARLTLSLCSGYGIKHPLSAIHPIPLSSPTTTSIKTLLWVV